MNMNNMYLEYRIINISDILNSTKFDLHAGYLKVLLFLKSHPSPLCKLFSPQCKIGDGSLHFLKAFYLLFYGE